MRADGGDEDPDEHGTSSPLLALAGRTGVRQDRLP
jgi:hypothetical protein